MNLIKGKITLKEQLNMLFVFEHAQLAATTTDASTPFTALIGCCFYICLSKPLSTPETVYFSLTAFFLFMVENMILLSNYIYLIVLEETLNWL